MEWRALKTYSIKKALPQVTVLNGGLQQMEAKMGEGFYICGDYLDTPSINGAMASGRRAAEAILADLQMPLPAYKVDTENWY